MAASAFSQAFSPWENPGTEPGARLSNLKVIFNKAADLGILMFSQPSVFRFDWKPGEAKMKPDEIVVSPELLKVADENAMALPRAQEMIKIKLSALRMVMEIDGAGENIPAELQGKHDQKGFRVSTEDKVSLEKWAQTTQTTQTIQYSAVPEAVANEAQARCYGIRPFGNDAYGMSLISLRQPRRSIQ